tara:strand:+ start:1026 stop:1754 length:729 start_codon:yes stop_codon:yes gene_type:complete
MAEEDLQLSVLKLTADGVEVIDVVDAKFTKLGSTMAKGKARAEGSEKALKELQKQMEKNTKTTTDNSVKNIESLMVLEAATSGINQLISARYKEIDAQLASGEITQEEAEELRKSVKQQEKYSSSLEKGIAMMRLYKVAQFAMAGAQKVATAATVGGTTAIKANTAALLKNPLIRFTVVVFSVAAAIAYANREFGFLSDQIEELDRRLEPVTRRFEALIEGIESITGFDIQNNRIFEALLTE